MDAERARTFSLTLPHVVETMQWGDNLVFWVGDKAIGGKMFALVNLDANAGALKHGVISFAAGKERAAELLEQEGLLPAPYLARIGWVAAERWNALRQADWEHEITAAYQLTLAKLPPRTQAILALPGDEQQALIAARKELVVARATVSKPKARRRKQAQAK